MAISDLIQETIAQHIVQPKVLSYAPSKLNEVTGRFVSANRIYNFVLDKSGVSYSPAGQGDSLLFSALFLRQDAARKPKIGNDKCNAGKSYQCGKICLGNRRKCHKGVRDVNDARRIASILESTNEGLKNRIGGEVSAKALKKGSRLHDNKVKGRALLEGKAKNGNAERKLKPVEALTTQAPKESYELPLNAFVSQEKSKVNQSRKSVRDYNKESLLGDIESAISRAGRDRVEEVFNLKPKEGIEDWLKRERENKTLGNTPIQRWSKEPSAFKDIAAEKQLRKSVVAYLKADRNAFLSQKDLDKLEAPLSSLPQKHKNAVEQAIKNGKNVPDEVLKDYPDLKNK